MSPSLLNCLLSYQIVQSVPATVNGVMGGFANLSSCDITGSKKFLLPFIQVNFT